MSRNKKCDQATILLMQNLYIQEAINIKLWFSMQHNKICNQTTTRILTKKNIFESWFGI
jgi:hypothetical protein